jgi:hypothetical protein
MEEGPKSDCRSLAECGSIAQFPNKSTHTLRYHGAALIRLKVVPTQAKLADRISSHRKAVLRELRLLGSEGLITWTRCEHVIHDPARLIKPARLN